MGVNSKHVATFLLGAAAALAAYKYSTMTTEEKEKLSSDIKEKANKLKDEAEAMMEKGKEYFEELKSKGADAFKEHFGDVSDMLNKFFSGEKGTETAASEKTAETTSSVS